MGRIELAGARKARRPASARRTRSCLPDRGSFSRRLPDGEGSMTPRNAMEQRAAKTVGLLLLLAPMTIMAVSYGIIWPLVSGLEAPQAARNIVTHEALYRVGLVGNLFYAVELVVLSAAIYAAAAGRPAAGAAGCAWPSLPRHHVGGHLRQPLRFAPAADRRRVPGAIPAGELHALARLLVSGFDRYYIALLFWSLGTMVAAWAWLRSGAVPRVLAAFGVVSSVWAVFCTVSLFLFPAFPNIVHLPWFDVPMLVFELAVGGLLFFRDLPHSAHVAE